MRNRVERALSQPVSRTECPWAGGILWRGVSLFTSSHCPGCWFGGMPRRHWYTPMGRKAGVYLQKRINAWKEFVEMANGLLLGARGFCHSCYHQVEGKDAAYGLQILSSPKDLEHQTELNLVLGQRTWSCPQQPSSTHVLYTNIPVLNMKYVMKRFLPLHPTETLLSVDVFHHLLHHVHPLCLASLFMHHRTPKEG